MIVDFEPTFLFCSCFRVGLDPVEIPGADDIWKSSWTEVQNKTEDGVVSFNRGMFNPPLWWTPIHVHTFTTHPEHSPMNNLNPAALCIIPVAIFGIGVWIGQAITTNIYRDRLDVLQKEMNRLADVARLSDGNVLATDLFESYVNLGITKTLSGDTSDGYLFESYAKLVGEIKKEF